MPRRENNTSEAARDREFWTALFSWNTWQQFLNAGANTAGYREKRWSAVQKIQPGDYMVCYLTGVSRWIGFADVTGPPFRSREPIWSEDDFPCRVPLKIVVALKPETAIPVTSMRKRLHLFADLKSPNAWSWHFYSAPKHLQRSDGETILAALRDAERNPRHTPFDQRKLHHKPAW